MPAHPPRWLSVVLGSLTALLAAIWLGLLWQHPADGRAPNPLTPRSFQSDPSAPGAEWDALIAAAPFGVSEGPNPRAPETQLPLRLLGVVAKSDLRAGRALIAAGGGGSQVYAAGAALPGGATLLEIWPTQVILQRGSQRESLTLPENALAPRTSGGSNPLAGPPGNVRTASSERAVPLRAPPPSNAPNALSRVMTWQTVLRAGQPSGVRIYPGADATTFETLGLRPGDLVLTVNQAPVADMNGGRDFAALLASSPMLQLGIEREGRPQTLQIDVSQLTAAGPSP
jgi:general secretion pathway protein C